MFDVDNTLVHTCKTPDERYKYYKIVVNSECLYVHVRPGVVELLHFFCRQNIIRFGIWTAGTRAYADAIVKGLFRHCQIFNWRESIAIIQSRKSAIKLASDVYIKDLSVTSKLLQTDVESIYLVDDNPIHAHHVNNKGRVLIIPAFYVHLEFDDRCIYTLLRIFETEKKKTNHYINEY